MNKKLFLLPILAFTLVSCGESEPEVPAHRHADADKDHICDVEGCGKVMSKCMDGDKDHLCDYCHQIMTICVDDNSNGYCDICNQMMAGELLPEPEEFGGYRMVSKPVEGKEYLLGMLQQINVEMMFVNGNRHYDEEPDHTKTYYPYYLGCERHEYDFENNPTGTGVDAGLNAAKFTVHYVDDTHFRIKIVEGTQKEDFYHGYLQVYGDYNRGVKTSLLFDEDVNKTYGVKTYDGMEPTEYAPCSNLFYILESYNNMNINAIATDFNNKCNTTDYGSQPVALGTYNDYISISATTANHFGTNFMVRFYEKIA